MKLEKMTPGMVLHSYGRDGTILRRKCSYPVRVVEVDPVKRMVFSSYNNNPPRWVAEQHAVKWRKVSYRDAEEAKALKLAGVKK